MKNTEVAGVDRPSSAELYARAIALANEGRYAEAEADFFEAARLQPDASLGWLSAALVGFPLGHHAKAATAIEWALRAIPIRDAPETCRAVARYEAGDLPAAKREFDTLIGRGRAESSTHMFMSLLLLKMGQPDEALRHLKEAYSQELAAAKS